MSTVTVHRGRIAALVEAEEGDHRSDCHTLRACLAGVPDSRSVGLEEHHIDHNLPPAVEEADYNRKELQLAEVHRNHQSSSAVAMSSHLASHQWEDILLGTLLDCIPDCMTAAASSSAVVGILHLHVVASHSLTAPDSRKT